MLRKAKLRGPIGRIYPIFFIGAHILAIIEFLIRRELIGNGMEITPGPIYITIIASLFLVLMGTYQWWRYHLWVYFALGLLAGISTLQSSCQYIDFFSLTSYIINIMLVIIFIILFWSTLAGQERYEIKARRLLKLAADSIEDIADGYTSRPYSAGKADLNFEETLGFARYLKSKHIVLPVNRDEGTYLCFSLGRSLLLHPDPKQVSYVFISREGDINVHISSYDYQQYTSRFTFDQLCRTLGDTFLRFLHYYKDGHEDRIIHELKSV